MPVQFSVSRTVRRRLEVFQNKILPTGRVELPTPQQAGTTLENHVKELSLRQTTLVPSDQRLHIATTSRGHGDYKHNSYNLG